MTFKFFKNDKKKNRKKQNFVLIRVERDLPGRVLACSVPTVKYRINMMRHGITLVWGLSVD